MIACRVQSVHEGHLVTVTDRDAPTIEAAGPDVLQTGWTGSASSFRDQLERVGDNGITEVIVTPADPEIEHERELFAAAVT